MDRASRRSKVLRDLAYRPSLLQERHGIFLMDRGETRCLRRKYMRNTSLELLGPVLLVQLYSPTALLPPRGCLQTQAQDGEKALPGKYSHDHVSLQVENQPEMRSQGLIELSTISNGATASLHFLRNR